MLLVAMHFVVVLSDRCMGGGGQLRVAAMADSSATFFFHCLSCTPRFANENKEERKAKGGPRDHAHEAAAATEKPLPAWASQGCCWSRETPRRLRRLLWCGVCSVSHGRGDGPCTLQ